MTVGIDDFGASFIKYLPDTIATFADKILASKVCKGKTLNWEGTKLQKTIHVAPSSAITSGLDGGAWPTSKKQGYTSTAAYRKFTMAKVGITLGLINNASTTENAAVTAIESELRGLMKTAMMYKNYFWTRDGTGVVTLLGATTGAGTTTMTVRDARLMFPTAEFTILDAGDGTTRHATATVASTARSYNNTLRSATVTTSNTMTSGAQAQNDYVVWGTGDMMIYGRALTGLDAGISDSTGTFQEVSGTTYPRWTSPVFSNSGTPRALTPSLHRRVLATLNQESDTEGGLVVVTDTPILAQMDEMYESAVRITPDTTTVGQKTPTFQSIMGTITVQNDRHNPYGTMFYVAPEEITYAVQKEWGWVPATSGSGSTSGGGNIFALDQQSARYVAYAMEQSELFYEQRNKCAKVTDIEETIDTAY